MTRARSQPDPSDPLSPLPRPALARTGGAVGDGATPSPGGEPPATPGTRFLNRDLSWLEFNARVVAMATDRRNPLLERVKFLAIAANNLDEFFMKRVGYLQTAPAARRGAGPDGMRIAATLEQIRRRVEAMYRTMADCWDRDLRPGLARAGIELVGYTSLEDAERLAIDAWFMANVFPVLTPLAVDPGHRFPFLSNLSESLGVTLTRPGSTEPHFARVKIPDVLPRLVSVPRDGGPVGAPSPTRGPWRLVQLEHIVQHNLDDLFPGMTIEEVTPFRITRNANVERDEDEGETLLEAVEDELQRRRFADVVRLEASPGASPGAIALISRELELEPGEVYLRPGPLEYADLFTLYDLNPAERAEGPRLKFPRWTPVIPPALGDGDTDLFARIREGDVLLHHPYESFTASVERFVATAARDPDVLAIKQTIYRTTPDSPFVEHLVHAAEEGKQVACLVELRARFDEDRNVRFARALEKAGVHVAYGVVGLKTHCKCSLVVRRERQGLRAYAHLGTGNYNPKTAQLYTDLGLLTCDPVITADVVSLFNVLTGHAPAPRFRELLVAPFAMRRAFAGLVRREIDHARAGRPARIIAKMNALEDKAMTDLLYEASGAGVDVQLYVRGFCCLRPGVPGLSEHVRVASVLGRFLEHARIFHFGDGREDPLDGDWYISSADWMYRNLDQRVEAATPIKQRQARAKLLRILDVMAQDRLRAWDMNPDGSYTLRMPPPDADPDSPAALGTFLTLMREANPAFPRS